MGKARITGTALAGTTITLSAAQGAETVGPLTISAWGTPTDIEQRILFYGQENAGGSTTDTVTISVPEWLVGDWTLVIGSGAGQVVSAATVDSDDAILRSPGAVGSGGRHSIFQYDLTGATGTGDIDVGLTFGNAETTYLLYVVAVKNGVWQTPEVNPQIGLPTGGAADFLNVAVPAERSLLLGLSIGRQEVFTQNDDLQAPEWTTLQQQVWLDPASDNDALAIAWRTNTPSGVYNESVAVTDGRTERSAHALIVFTPVGASAPSEIVSQWTIVNEGSATGDIALVDIQANPFKEGHVAHHYDIEIQKAGGTVVERVLLGPVTNYPRRHRMDVNTTTTCRLRAVYRNLSDGTLYTSDWSPAKTVTTTTVAARLTLTKSLDTVFVGEAALITCDVHGFDTTRPEHEVDYFGRCTDAAEVGTIDVMPPIYEAYFGTPNRHETRARAFAFAPQTAGTKTIEYTVRDASGNVATASTTITAVDPITTFAASEIHALSTGEDFAGLPVGSNQYTTFAALKAGLPASGDVLILFHDDEVVGDGSRIELKNHGTVMFRRYGGGTLRPSVNAAFVVTASRAIADGINQEGLYEPDNVITGDHRAPIDDGIDFKDSVHGSIANSRSHGWSKNWTYPRPNKTGVIFNSESSDWANYGIFGDDVGRIGWHGVAVFQNTNCLRGNINKFPANGELAYPAHGPARSSRPQDDMTKSCAYFFTNNNHGGENSVQGADRLFGSGYTPRPLKIHNTQYMIEGGDMSIGHTSDAGGLSSSQPQDARFSGFVLICTTNPPSPIQCRIGGTTYENGLVIAPDQLQEVLPAGFTSMVNLENITNVGLAYPRDDIENQPIRFRNCTFVSLLGPGRTQDDARDDLRLVNTFIDFQDYTFDNCVFHYPNVGTPFTGFAPLDTTFLGVSGTYQGRRVVNPVLETIDDQPEYFTPNESIATFAVQSGSSGYQTATGPIAIRDGRGNLRPSGTASMGWLEP